jgi:hypothetical protein
MTLGAGDRLGPYEILGAVGAGGMGEVYRAHDPRLGRTVAIKVLPASVSSDPGRRQRFEHEARATGLLNHPNILAVHDVGDHDGAPYLVTELLEGETLRERLQAGAVPVRKAVDYALQVARGLGAAHDKGIVHRDLKPENLFVTKDGIVKILDFGLARQAVIGTAEDTHSPTLARDTGPGVLLGTVAYMSPEQARGQTADRCSDLFALGSVLFEMLAGRRAFHGDTSVETLSAILKEEPPEFPTEAQVPPALDRVVRHCLEKKPGDRFQSARDLVFGLEGLSGSSVAAGKAVPADTVRSRRRLAIAGLASLLVLAALAGALVAARRSAPPEIPTYRQITFRRGIAASGRFTPDGKTVVYAASWDDAPAPEVYSVRTDAPESKPLGLPPGQVVGVSAKGELAMLLPPAETVNGNVVYPSGPGTLARVPLSGGEPRPVAESVICADWAPDGERLAALRSVGGALQVEFPLGTVLARESPAERGLSCPRFSPRGDRLAFGVLDGYRVIETTSGRSFSVEGVSEMSHGQWWSWGPDGEEIWFTASDAIEGRPLEAVSLSGRRRVLARIPGAMTIYDVSRDGLVLLEHAFTRVRVFARAPGEAGEREVSVFDRTALGDLSADGRLVLLSERGAATGSRQFIYLRRTDGSPPMRLADEGEPWSLSPDGRWALVGPPSLLFEVPRWSGLRVVPIGAGDVRTIDTPGLQVGGAVWAADGRRILVWDRAADRGWRLSLVDGEGGAPRPVSPEGVVDCTVGRQRVACVGPTNRVTFFPLEGGAPQQGPELEPGASPLRLSDDETSLLVFPLRATRTSPLRVERLDFATGRRTLIHEIRPADMAGVCFFFRPILVTPDGRGYAYTSYQFLHSLFLADGVR